MFILTNSRLQQTNYLAITANEIHVYGKFTLKLVKNSFQHRTPQIVVLVQWHQWTSDWHRNYSRFQASVTCYKRSPELTVFNTRSAGAMKSILPKVDLEDSPRQNYVYTKHRILQMYLFNETERFRCIGVALFLLFSCRF